MSVLNKQPLTPDRFLANYESQRDWTLPAGVSGVEPIAAFDGHGSFALVECYDADKLSVLTRRFPRWPTERFATLNRD
jgi:hypothetical protein